MTRFLMLLVLYRLLLFNTRRSSPRYSRSNSSSSGIRWLRFSPHRNPSPTPISPSSTTTRLHPRRTRKIRRNYFRNQAEAFQSPTKNHPMTTTVTTTTVVVVAAVAVAEAHRDLEVHHQMMQEVYRIDAVQRKTAIR